VEAVLCRCTAISSNERVEETDIEQC
jgi:hypothetical protein